MKIWYYIAVGFVLVLGIGISVHFGLKGRPIPKIKISRFQSTEEVSGAIHNRLYQEILQSPILAIGVEPSNSKHLELVNKFIGTLIEERIKYPSMIIESGLELQELIPAAESLDIKIHHKKIVENIKLAAKENQRILFIVPQIYATHLVDRSPISKIEQDSGVKIMSITIVPLVGDRSEINTQYFPCQPDGQDFSGLSPLGCVVQNSANAWQLKKIGDAKIAGKLEQYGISDYILFYRNLL